MRYGSTDLVREYLLLVWRLDRLVPGTADGIGSDPRAVVRAEPPRSPSALVRAAGTLADALPGPLDPVRARFLRGQLVAIEWAARRLAGQPVPFVAEVAAAFDTRISLGAEDGYRAAHRELDALVPGSGPLSSRMAEYRRRGEIPRDRLAVAVRALSEALRERCGALLPTGEQVTYAIVDSAPWAALHHYRGANRSLVTINGGAHIRRAQLARLLAHEAYPGHHTERCRKEQGLIARGWDEHGVVVANTPQSLVAEGAADLGLRAVVGPGWGRFAADVLGEVGLGFDGELAEHVADASETLGRVRQDAALLLHDRRAPTGAVSAHLRRWLLVDEPRVEEIGRFLRDPLWRAYTTAYVEGAALVRRWWEHAPPGEDRLRRVLDEPITPRAIREELTAVAPIGHRHG